MGQASAWQEILGFLRGWKPGYRALRSLWRGARGLFYEVVRRMGPRDSRFGGPRGAFSALAQLQAGTREGRILFLQQEVPPALPGGVRQLDGLGQDRPLAWPVFWTRHREARLAGRYLALLDQEKRICNEATYQQGDHFGRDANYDYVVLPRAERLEGPWMSLVSLFGQHFYHWLHDELPRLWALSEFPKETRILISADAPSYVRDTLAWLGLSDRVRETRARHLIVEDFYLSAPTAMYGFPNPFGLRFLRERLLPFAAPLESTPKRIYLQRSGKTRGIANEMEVRDFFVRRGWALVDPEKSSLAEQMRLFQQAEAICGLHGGAFTNLVWCSPGCRVLELFGEGFLNGGYEGMAQCLDLQHRFLLFPDDGQMRARADLTRIEAVLQEWGI